MVLLMGDAPHMLGLVPMPGNGQGIAPYGVRHDGMGAKGKGYYGGLPAMGGSDAPGLEVNRATEYSMGANVGGREMEIPSIVPGLSPEQLQAVQRGEIPPEVARMAIAHALMRQRQGKGVFGGGGEMRYPLPVGGLPVRGRIPGVNGMMPTSQPPTPVMFGPAILGDRG